MNPLSFSPAVSKAMKENKPVIALESTIISHGMPYPQNVQTAHACEEEARKLGVEPATIAVIRGKLCVGLTGDQIEYLGKAGARVAKASRRDLPALAAGGLDGATTVAATMLIAALAGIRFFATGGIGGVHRGAETTMDISADLQELARTPVGVVCAGVKSILDIGLTLEYLETYGVPVIGYQTNEMPAFFTRSSGFPIDMSANAPGEIAAIYAMQRELRYRGGMLIVNPIPEAYSMDKGAIDQAITAALDDCRAQNITGKAVTPFLLSRVKKLTGGQSLASNIQLVLSNVRLAAQIAREMS